MNENICENKNCEEQAITAMTVCWACAYAIYG